MTSPLSPPTPNTPENEWPQALWDGDIEKARVKMIHLSQDPRQVQGVLNRYLMDAPKVQLHVVEYLLSRLPNENELTEKNQGDLSSLWEFCRQLRPFDLAMMDLLAAKIDPIYFFKTAYTLGELDQPLDLDHPRARKKFFKALNLYLEAILDAEGDTFEFFDQVLSRLPKRERISDFERNLVDFFQHEKLHMMPLLMSKLSKDNLLTNMQSTKEEPEQPLEKNRLM